MAQAVQYKDGYKGVVSDKVAKILEARGQVRLISDKPKTEPKTEPKGDK